MRTFWCSPKQQRGSSSANSSNRGDDDDVVIKEGSTRVAHELHRSQKRLVDWIVSLMLQDIKKIVYARTASGGAKRKSTKHPPTYNPPAGNTCMDEVKEVIHMPEYDATKKVHNDGGYKEVTIDEDIVAELTSLVTAIASMYRSNPFHNCKFASRSANTIFFPVTFLLTIAAPFCPQLNTPVT